MSTQRGGGPVVGLPAGLASMPPGPELAGLLASVDRSAVGCAELPDLVAARARLAAHTEAELLADLWEAARGILNDSADGAARCGDEEVIEQAARVLAWVLHCSEGYAQDRVRLGRALVQRLPMVLASLRAGRIDSAKARVIVEALAAVVDDDLARLIATKVLRKAGGQTLAQVRAGLRYHIDRHDPGSARRRYRRRVVQRAVFLRAHEDGTADLSVVNLPPHRAAQAYDRVDRIARCARAGGDGRNLAQLRADAAADLLAGIAFQTRPTVDALTHEADITEPAPPETVDPPGWVGTDARFPDPDGGGPGPVWGEHGPLDPPWRPTPPDRTHPGITGWPDEPIEPADAPGRIDLYDYDQWCLTDEDRWWIGYRDEPAGAAGTSDDDPRWWSTATTIHPPPTPTSPTARVPTATPTPTRPTRVSAAMLRFPVSATGNPGRRWSCPGRCYPATGATVAVS